MHESFSCMLPLQDDDTQMSGEEEMPQHEQGDEFIALDDMEEIDMDGDDAPDFSGVTCEH